MRWQQYRQQERTSLFLVPVLLLRPLLFHCMHSRLADYSSKHLTQDMQGHRGPDYEQHHRDEHGRFDSIATNLETE